MYCVLLSLSAAVDATNIQCPLEEWYGTHCSVGASQVIQIRVRFKGHFVHITFSKAHTPPVLFSSMLCFAMEILPFSLKKQTFSSCEGTWILHDILGVIYGVFSAYYMGMVNSGASRNGQWKNDKYPHQKKKVNYQQTLQQSWWSSWHDKDLTLIRYAYH